VQSHRSKVQLPANFSIFGNRSSCIKFQGSGSVCSDRVWLFPICNNHFVYVTMITRMSMLHEIQC